MQQYKPLTDQEEIQMGKNAANAVGNDREVVASLELAVKAFKRTGFLKSGSNWLTNAFEIVADLVC
jgi:hypothetical protein